MSKYGPGGKQESFLCSCLASTASEAEPVLQLPWGWWEMTFLGVSVAVPRV